jgi:hypothetical protein
MKGESAIPIQFYLHPDPAFRQLIGVRQMRAEKIDGAVVTRRKGAESHCMTSMNICPSSYHLKTFGALVLSTSVRYGTMPPAFHCPS